MLAEIGGYVGLLGSSLIDPNTKAEQISTIHLEFGGIFRPDLPTLIL